MLSQFFTKTNILFVCKFLGSSLLLTLAFEYAPVLSQRDVWTHFLAAASCTIIQTATPAEKCVRHSSTLLSHKTPVVIVTEECDGINALILLTAAIISFPCLLRFKFAGLALGCSLLVACNIARITALYYVSRHFYPYFDAIHTMVAPMATIMPTVIFYFIWLSQAKQNDLAI